MERGVVKAAVTVLALLLNMSASEFAALQRLPAQARRERLGMPATCRPGLTAIKGNPAGSAQITVLVTCKARRAEPAPRPTESTPSR